jgi:uncharacterized damage-inducible protein DinB
MAKSPAGPAWDAREALLAVYAINDVMNQLILSHLEPRAWRAKLPGDASRGPRTIGAILAHVHNVRVRWLRYNAPHLNRPAPLNPHRCTMKQASAALKRSAEQCLKMLSEALSSDPRRRIQTFARDSWMPVWPANAAMFAYMFGHEAHHRGQILMLAHQLGCRIPPAKIYPIWYWDKLWKQAGVPRPR